MENLMVCLNAILPLLCIMLLGYAARRMGMLSDGEVIKMNSIGFFFFMPCLLFDSVYSADLSGAVAIENHRVVCYNIILIKYIMLAVCASEPNSGRKGQSYPYLILCNSGSAGACSCWTGRYPYQNHTASPALCRVREGGKKTNTILFQQLHHKRKR